MKKLTAQREYLRSRIVPLVQRWLLGIVLAGVGAGWQRPVLAADLPPRPAGMHLTFDSEFAGGIGAERWMTTGATGWRTLPANKEAEYYSDASVGVDPFSVADGVLTITASVGHNPAGLPYNSGLLTTFRSFSQLYGYFEMRARLPAGAGLWPALWLLPANGGWPPEIDVLEQLGSDPAGIFVGTHSAVGGPNIGTTTGIRTADTSLGFHVYAVDWEPTEITWFFDGAPIFKEPTPADMHTPMYLLINLAVGGPGSWPGPPTPATVFPAHMQVAYLRAYAR